MEKLSNGSERLSIGPHLKLVKDLPLFKCKHFYLSTKILLSKPSSLVTMHMHQQGVLANYKLLCCHVCLQKLPPKTTLLVKCQNYSMLLFCKTYVGLLF